MILSSKDCEIHIKHNIPYTIEKPFPEGIAHLSEGYSWDYRSGQFYIKKDVIVLDKPNITIFYDDGAGWGVDGCCGDKTFEVPYDADEDMVVGILCVLTGKVKYAKYMINNPEDNKKVDTYWDWNDVH